MAERDRYSSLRYGKFISESAERMHDELGPGNANICSPANFGKFLFDNRKN